MKLGIISDTHDNKETTEKLLNAFKERDIDTILHAGDLISPFMLNFFEDFETYMVEGNNDGDIYRLMKHKPAGFSFSDDFMKIQLEDTIIGIDHGTSQEVKKGLEESQRYDVLVSGHTHEAKAKKVGKTLSLNPGTAHGFKEKGTAMILDLEAEEVKLIKA